MFCKEITETLIDASKVADIRMNIEKTNYMLVSRHQNAGQNRVVKIADRSLQIVSQFKYLETAVTNRSLSHEENKRRLNSVYACYHSVQNFLSSRVRFEAFTTVTRKNSVFWDVTPCGSCKNRRFEGT
jgi:hypothetical protein